MSRKKPIKKLPLLGELFHLDMSSATIISGRSLILTGKELLPRPRLTIMRVVPLVYSPESYSGKKP